MASRRYALKRDGCDGIPTVRRLGPQGPRSQPRHRHVRRHQRLLQALGPDGRGGGRAPRRHLPGGRRQLLRHGRHLLRRRLGGDPGAGDQGQARAPADLDQGDLHDRRGAQRRRLVALPPRARLRGEPQAARHRPHRHLLHARLRRPDAGGGNLARARRPRAGRQDRRHRLLQLLRLAPDEGPGDLGEIRPRPLRRLPGLLRADRPALRVGADAARPRPGASA